MKKFSDAITVVGFFTILIMFAVSTLFFQNSTPLSQLLEDGGSVRRTAVGFVEDNFPLNANWRSMYTEIMALSGKSRFGNTYYTGDKLIKLGGTGRDNSIENVAYVNELAVNTECPIYLMLAPTAAGVYSAEIPELFADNNQRDMINDAYMQLDRRIVSIDAFYPLYSARDEYVYYRTENLWTSFGAYYAYAESMRQLGAPAVTLQNYDQEFALSDFYGSLYASAMVGSIQPDMINVFRSKYQSPVTEVDMYSGDEVRKAGSVYFRSALGGSRKTDIFLLGDRYYKTDIFTDNVDSPDLLVIKGSFANAIAPFYTAHYRRITMVDPKRLKEEGMTLSDVADPDDYDQILVLFDIDSFSKAEYFDTLK